MCLLRNSSTVLKAAVRVQRIWQADKHIHCVSLDDKAFSLTKGPDHEFFSMSNNEHLITILLKLFAHPIIHVKQRQTCSKNKIWSPFTNRKQISILNFKLPNWNGNTIDLLVPTLQHFKHTSTLLCLWDMHSHGSDIKNSYKVGPLSRECWANITQYLLSSQVASTSFILSKPPQKF